MRPILPLILALSAALAACNRPPVPQYVVTAADPGPRVPIRVSSVEVREISLPRYATADAITVQSEDGALRELPDTAWADDPQRALTLALARSLSTVSSARVAAEPWPFADPPAASVTVRIEELLARPNGTLTLVGNYAIGPVDSDLADRDGTFDITVPMTQEPPGGVAIAQSAALGDLAVIIARRISR